MKRSPQYKICRRLGPGVFDKCQTTKFATSTTGKNKKSNSRPKALSDYAVQFLEKQRVRLTYGVTERQFSNYVKKAQSDGGSAAESLYKALETRLDNVVYRLGLAASRAQARQMVSHGHFTVNGTKVRIPSYTVKTSDVIAVRQGSTGSALFTELDKKLKNTTTSDWLAFDITKLAATLKGYPKNPESSAGFSTVLEFYSR